MLISCIFIGFFMLYIGSVISRKNKVIIRERKEHQDKLVQTMLESISFARDLLIFNSWGWQTREYNQQNKGVISTEVSSSLLLNILNSVLEMLCGKSTILKLILGLLPQFSGKILIDGREVNYEDLCSSPFMAGAFQEPYIFKDTILHNIALGAVIDIDLMDKCITAVELAETIEMLPDGLSTVIGEGARELSTGQKQRIGIARALYKKPKLLVLDEATASIDSSTEEKILRNIKEAFPGTHQELVEECTAYRQLYLNQI